MAIFLGETMISDLEPKDYTASTFSFSDAYLSTLEFMSEHFRGAVEVSAEMNDACFISVSGSGLSYFIKRLLLIIFGESLLKIHIKSTRFSLVYNLSWKRQACLTEEQKREFQNIASLSGFEAILTENEDGGSFTLNFNILHAPEIPIYAQTPRNMRADLEKIFFYLQF